MPTTFVFIEWTRARVRVCSVWEVAGDAGEFVATAALLSTNLYVSDKDSAGDSGCPEFSPIKYDIHLIFIFRGYVPTLIWMRLMLLLFVQRH